MLNSVKYVSKKSICVSSIKILIYLVHLNISPKESMPVDFGA